MMDSLAINEMSPEAQVQFDKCDKAAIKLIYSVC